MIVRVDFIIIIFTLNSFDITFGNLNYMDGTYFPINNLMISPLNF